MREGVNDFICFVSQKLAIAQRTLATLYTAIAMRTPVLLRGPPGTGKTELTRIVAEYLGAEYHYYQCTFGTTEDDLLYRYVPSENTKSGVRILEGVLPTALRASRNHLTVVVLDEFDKTRATTDAVLLDFLQNCRVSLRINEHEDMVQGCRENLVVFVVSNDEREFSEPLMRRLAVIKLERLTKEPFNPILV